MESMKDVKEVLNEIPNDVLEEFVVGQNEDGELCLMCTDGGETGNEVEMMSNWDKHMKAHRGLRVLDAFVKQIGKNVEDEDGEPVFVQENQIK